METPSSHQEEEDGVGEGKDPFASWYQVWQ